MSGIVYLLRVLNHRSLRWSWGRNTYMGYEEGKKSSRFLYPKNSGVSGGGSFLRKGGLDKDLKSESVVFCRHFWGTLLVVKTNKLENMQSHYLKVLIKHTSQFSRRIWDSEWGVFCRHCYHNSRSKTSIPLIPNLKVNRFPRMEFSESRSLDPEVESTRLRSKTWETRHSITDRKGIWTGFSLRLLGNFCQLSPENKRSVQSLPKNLFGSS